MRKFIYFVVFILPLALFIFNIYLYVQQPVMVFHPLKELEVTPKDWGLSYENVNLRTVEDEKVSAWYLPHPEAVKTILFFHGNGGNISHRGDSIYIFHKLKLNVLIVDYVGYGDSDGSPSEIGLYQSADAAWQYLVKVKKINQDSIIIFGRSLGGAVATDLASRVKAGGLILESSFSSVRDILNIIMPILSPFIYLRYSMDSFSKLTRVDVPVLIIHSAEDEVIPFQLGQKLFYAVESKKEFLQISGGHNDGFMQSIGPYMQKLRLFTQSL